MPINVPVELGDRRYDILIGEGLIGAAQAYLEDLSHGKNWVVVTDEHLAKHWLPVLASGLSDPIDPIILPAGEQSKSWQQLGNLCDQLLERGVERSHHIIALGGGVIGDLVGFASSILKRGCGFVQIPTTLLSQVDSSVGGKTAINTVAGKNLVGTFHQPARVLIDPLVLKTLPLRELRAGYAEVVKYGLINDPAFFNWCEANGVSLLSGNVSAQTYAIEASVRAKAAIVVADERELADLRALLNLGHTFGHALEAETDYSDRLLHGEAVAAGMGLAFRFSARQGLCAPEAASRVARHLAACGLPNGIAPADLSTNAAVLVGHMAHDKKVKDGQLAFILAKGIGQAFVDKTVEIESVSAFLAEEMGMD